MTKKTKLLLTSFATIAMSASLVVGGTYALFTSETKVDISVKAGQVKMTATADNFKVYSGKWNSSTKVYDDELQSGMVFANGGVVTVNDKNNVIAIDRMTPTDMVEFDIHVENESDVIIQYQTILTPVEGTDTKLYDVLDVTIDGVTYEGTAAYSNWQILQPGTDVDVTVSVKMPWDVGNEYQGLTASFAYVVKAVQGNADTAYYFNDDVVLKGQTYTIESDTEQDFAFNIEGAQNVQLTDMNYQFTNYWYGVHMKNVANATLTNVTAETNIGMPVYATRGTNATLNNVAATTHSNDPSGWPNSAFAAAGSSVVTINGGTYVSEYGAAVYAFNSGAEITINDGTFTGKTAAVWADGNVYSGSAMNSHIIIKGGTFKGAIREEQGGEITIYGGTFDTDPTAFVAEGYQAVQNADGTYTVKPYDVASSDELKDALANDKAVSLNGDITFTGEKQAGRNDSAEAYGNKVGFAQYGGVLDGNGNEIIDGEGDRSYVIVTHGGTIKNLTVTTGARGIVTYAPTENVYIDNVVVDGAGYALNSTEYGYVDMFVTNSTINGWTSLAGFKSVNFTNCKLGANSKKYWQGFGYDADYDRLFRVYSDTYFTDCEFEKGYYLDLSAGGTAHLKNCTVNGVKLTAENYADYVTIELPAGTALSDVVTFA
ncbi:MAG: hypothetical protein J6A63_10410 [Clostridia bacterium]|nr:hypothetical protein [Clostridia bacterium]